MLGACMLPASDGDCIVLRYGARGERRLLVDGGRASTHDAIIAYADQLPKLERRFELLVVTHVDADHIAGALRLVQQKSPALSFNDVWFNAYRHLLSATSHGQADLEAFGPLQGEKLTNCILAQRWPWNAAFDGGAVFVGARGFHEIQLPDGLRITLLSPNLEKLRALEAVWSDALLEANMLPSQPDPRDVTAPIDFEAFGGVTPPDVETLAFTGELKDQAAANGSSIAFLAEHGGKRVLCAADAHPDLLEEGIRRMADLEGGRLRVDLFKVSHHGSGANTSRAMLEAIDCRRFLFSTDGSRHSHPDPQTVARIVRFCSPEEERTLFFNYRQKNTLVWEDPDLKRRYGYVCVFPEPGRDGWLEALA